MSETVNNYNVLKGYLEMPRCGVAAQNAIPSCSAAILKWALARVPRQPGGSAVWNARWEGAECSRRGMRIGLE